MTARFDPTRLDRVPPPIHDRPARPAVPSVRQLWLADPGSIDRARDVIHATDVGRQLLADEPRRLVRAPGLDREARGFILLAIAATVTVLLAVIGAVTLGRWVWSLAWRHPLGVENALFWLVTLCVAETVRRCVNRSDQ
jgi:hypothetical protein